MLPSRPRSRDDDSRRPERSERRSRKATPRTEPTCARPSVDALGRTPSAGARALVIGGGGATGNAWLIGVVGGLCEAGLDVTEADLTIGTSAGATAAAQFAGASPADLLAATLAAPPAAPRAAPRARPAASATAGAIDGSRRPGSDHRARLREVIASSADAAGMRRRLGAAALVAPATADDARQAQWRATVAARLPDESWPQRRLLITAVDARTGTPLAFDRDSGVGLVDAVAASCSGGGFAYRIGDGRYIDGGYRSNPDNADLAAGFERVLVLSPLGGRSLFPEAWGLRLAAQVEQLRAGGSTVETIFPGPGSETWLGSMDVSLRPLAARAGYEQGRALAERLAAFWR